MAKEKQDENEKQDVPGEDLIPVVRKVLTDVRWLLALACSSIIAVFLAGWTAMAAVRDESRTVAKEQTATQAEELKQLRHIVDELREEQKDTNAEVKDTKGDVRELRSDLRRLFPALPKSDGGK